MQDRQEKIQQIVVTAQQMREIEGRVFTAGMPVAALMEKVGGSDCQSSSSALSLFTPLIPLIDGGS